MLYGDLAGAHKKGYRDRLLWLGRGKAIFGIRAKRAIAQMMPSCLGKKSTKSTRSMGTFCGLFDMDQAGDYSEEPENLIYGTPMLVTTYKMEDPSGSLGFILPEFQAWSVQRARETSPQDHFLQSIMGNSDHLYDPTNSSQTPSEFHNGLSYTLSSSHCHLEPCKCSALALLKWHTHWVQNVGVRSMLAELQNCMRHINKGTLPNIVAIQSWVTGQLQFNRISSEMYNHMKVLNIAEATPLILQWFVKIQAECAGAPLRNFVYYLERSVALDTPSYRYTETSLEEIIRDRMDKFDSLEDSHHWRDKIMCKLFKSQNIWEEYSNTFTQNCWARFFLILMPAVAICGNLYVGKISISLKRLATCPGTLQGHMVLSGLQQIGGVIRTVKAPQAPLLADIATLLVLDITHIGHTQKNHKNNIFIDYYNIPELVVSKELKYKFPTLEVRHTWPVMTYTKRMKLADAIGMVVVREQESSNDDIISKFQLVYAKLASTHAAWCHFKYLGERHGVLLRVACRPLKGILWRSKINWTSWVAKAWNSLGRKGFVCGTTYHATAWDALRQSAYLGTACDYLEGVAVRVPSALKPSQGTKRTQAIAMGLCCNDTAQWPVMNTPFLCSPKDPDHTQTLKVFWNILHAGHILIEHEDEPIFPSLRVATNLLDILLTMPSSPEAMSVIALNFGMGQIVVKMLTFG
ncbi:hypothetical protein C8R45DRAFT_1157811 [Mycena sanguinolenta]|nr:hypothetical protein C8R45DRAFT_1157811 [Mycena sanguinolenta]